MSSLGKKYRLAGRVSLLLAAMVGLLGAAGIALTLARFQPAAPEVATVLPAPLPLPDFALTGHDDKAFTRDRLTGQVSLVFFGFTQCPDICPVTLQQLSVVRRRLEEAGAEVIPEIVFVSVDPSRDDTETLAEYVNAFGNGVYGVRGDLDSLNVLTEPLGVFHARPETDDGYDVEHMSAVLVINQSAEFAALFRPPHEIEAIVADWPGLMRQL